MDAMGEIGARYFAGAARFPRFLAGFMIELIQAGLDAREKAAPLRALGALPLG